MDQNWLLLLSFIVFNVFFYLKCSSGHTQNVLTDVELEDSAPKWPPSENTESVSAVTRKADGDCSPVLPSSVGKKGVKRKIQIRGVIRGGFGPCVGEDAGSHSEVAGLDGRSESATGAAQKAFEAYLERSDYFRSRRSEYFPSSKMPRNQGRSAPVYTSPGRRKLASTSASAWERQVNQLRFERNSTILDQKFMYLIVSQAGDGNFTTVQDAVDFVREENSQRVIIRIRAGFYREKVVVPHNKPYITFHGDNTRNTIISWNATAASPVTLAAHTWNSSEGFALFGTMQSASVTVLSDYFVAQNIAFQNSAPSPKPGAENSQAVAFLIAGDTAAFYDCSFLGAQDTLYDYKGRHYYHRCFIQGSIDFIFGNGRTLFENCTLSSIATRFGAIAAQQRRTPDEDTGFAFVGCYVTGTGSVYLGRAWSPFAKIVFAHSYFEDIIDAEGWSDFGDPRRHDTIYFGLYQCSGPGSKPARLVPWSRNLTVDEVQPYLGQIYVNGHWLGYPRNSTLLPDP